MYESISLLVKHFLISGFLLMALWKRSYDSLFDWLVMTIVTGVYVTFIFLSGQWYLYGILPRYTLLLLLIGGALYSLFLHRRQAFWVKKDVRGWLFVGFVGFISLIFMTFTVWAFLGSKIQKPGLELSFPLKGGTFHILEGGDSPWLNTYHRFPDIPNKYSVDITRVSNAGLRLGGDNPDNSGIFGNAVFSPLDGRVISIVDTLPDTGTRSAEDTSYAEVYGNRVLLQSGSFVLMLAHLRQGSVGVAAGDAIAAGEKIAEVGKSGETSEPLLHIHAYEEVDNPPWDGVGIPLFFDGRFPCRNMIFTMD